jgi:peptidyl-prolyl cis-trans isomerase A (cyclophilin A)
MGLLLAGVLATTSTYAIDNLAAATATNVAPAAASTTQTAAPATTTAPAVTAAPAAAATAAPTAPAATAAKPEAVKPTATTAPAGTATKSIGTVVEIKTSEGSIKVELADKEAPISVANFVAYVNSKFYDGTVFHRVIDGFMIQGGGYTVDGEKLNEKPTKAPIANEAKNGLKNDKGTIAMARTSNPESGTSQFYINLVNNDRLNYPNPDGHGYAVFGRVIEGLDIIEKIGKTRTAIRFNMQDFPVADVKIISASVVKPTSH